MPGYKCSNYIPKAVEVVVRLFSWDRGSVFLAVKDGSHHATGFDSEMCMATLKVQQAACISLRMLHVISGQFAGEAVNLLSYVLNDDSLIVRLEALKTLHHMATIGCLKMQEEQIDMVAFNTAVTIQNDFLF